MVSDGGQLDLEAIRARAGTATEGPWFLIDDEFEAPGVWMDRDGEIGFDVDRVQDAAFIAAARSDVPALVAEVERLRAEVAFQNEMRELATKTAATIADLDEEAPALRQLLRGERERRLAAEGTIDRLTQENARLTGKIAATKEALVIALKSCAGHWDVIEKAKAWAATIPATSFWRKEDIDLRAAVDALTQPAEEASDG